VIVKTYVKPRKSKWFNHTPVVPALPSPIASGNETVDQQAFQDAGALSHATTRAAKIGISTDEYLRRSEIVKQQVRECPFRTNDIIYPPTKEEMHKYGKCLVVGRILSYGEIDHDTWPSSDLPFILTIQSLDKDKPQELIVTTGNWPKKHAPD